MKYRTQREIRITPKGQVSIEFLIFVGVILFLFAVASYAAISSTTAIRADNEVTDARRIASAVAGEINTAVEIGSGYSHKFYLPALLYDGSNYTANLSQNRFVYVFWKDKAYSLPVIAENTTGTVKTGLNTIRNVNGVISFD